MKMADILVSLFTKKGLIWESQDVDMEIDIPESALKVDTLDKTSKITVRLKAKNVTIKVLKDKE